MDKDKFNNLLSDAMLKAISHGKRIMAYYSTNIGEPPLTEESFINQFMEENETYKEFVNDDHDDWIKINTEEDLPTKGMTYYYICVDGRPSIHPHNLKQVISLYHDGMCSHYSPLKQKSPPNE